MLSLSVSAALCCIGLFLPGAKMGHESALGEGVLARAFAQRESLSAGVVRVYQVWDLGDAVIERDETGYFDDEHYRLDIHSHSEFARAYERRGLSMPDPFAVLIWDGQHVLRARADFHSTQYTLRSIRRTGLPFYNVRRLGIPLVTSPQTDLRCGYRDAKVPSVSREGSLFTLVFECNRVVGDGTVRVTDSTVTFTIDSSKDWSLISYLVEERAWGHRWMLKGQSVPAKFGDVWFPAWHRHEQWRDGVFDWAREYHVLEAEFNKPLPADTFSWKATGIPLGCPIVNHVGGTHLRWTGSEAVPLYPAPARDPAPKPELRKESD
jgi:hypothetical protein